MKKFILSFAIAALVAGGTITFASVNNNSEIVQLVQDGKKKATATKKSSATKKEDCDGEKAKSKDTGCQGESVVKKGCCSDGKTAKTKTTSPEKK
ncbi:MAG: hypothetical protein GQ527_12705 [Bacteroidales bacterium]|nr:hypothetical protein [Bacteroidales bacterium]